MAAVGGVLAELNLATVCREAACPNRAECFGRGTATFMILGRLCTRSCGFCAVEHGEPLGVRADEPQAVAEAAWRMKLRHVVITSVTRDDLNDGGAGHFAEACRAVRRRLPKAVIEILTPDFQGEPRAIQTALSGGADVFNHNVETVPRLYPAARPQADYQRSLRVLDRAKALAGGRTLTKSGVMAGLGETRRELHATMRDLRGAGCDILTVGQYLSPSPRHLPVARFVEPAEFDEIRSEALELGFAAVAAAPLVRSSYNAESLFREIRGQIRMALP